MRKLWYISRFGDSTLPSQLLPRKFAIPTCLSSSSNKLPRHTFSVDSWTHLTKTYQSTIKVSIERSDFSVYDDKNWIKLPKCTFSMALFVIITLIWDYYYISHILSWYVIIFETYKYSWIFRWDFSYNFFLYAASQEM